MMRRPAPPLRELGLHDYLFISHDLIRVRYLLQAHRRDTVTCREKLVCASARRTRVLPARHAAPLHKGLIGVGGPTARPGDLSFCARGPRCTSGTPSEPFVFDAERDPPASACPVPHPMPPCRSEICSTVAPPATEAARHSRRPPGSMPQLRAPDPGRGGGPVRHEQVPP